MAHHHGELPHLWMSSAAPWTPSILACTLLTGVAGLVGVVGPFPPKIVTPWCMSEFSGVASSDSPVCWVLQCRGAEMNPSQCNGNGWHQVIVFSFQGITPHLGHLERCPYLSGELKGSFWLGTLCSLGHHASISTWQAYHRTHLLLSLKGGSSVEDQSESSLLPA